ncbi:hypothetical protein ABIE61_003760 [Marinobacterium sp. MBR-111]|uniref:hypothetical protein n=1 Tax=Marinobacterium sp. MBR-111 TaxID=3156463 RepID=UPI0033983137
MNYTALPQNPNLTLFTQKSFKGLPVNASPEHPCIYEYLENSWQAISRSKYEYNRVYAVRIELLYPISVMALGTEDNQVMERFKNLIP